MQPANGGRLGVPTIFHTTCLYDDDRERKPVNKPTGSWNNEAITEGVVAGRVPSPPIVVEFWRWPLPRVMGKEVAAEKKSQKLELGGCIHTRLATSYLPR